MKTRRALRLLATLALLAPLAAVAVPMCAPGPHCPMAAATDEVPPCHRAAIRAEDCCLTATTPAAVETAPVIATADAAAVGATLAPRLAPGAGGLRPAPAVAPPAPLYRLFRTLLL